MRNESNRGMIKWAPFKSLNEQETFLSKMRQNKAKIERPIILPDKIEEINETLSSYEGGEVEIHYYERGGIFVIRGEIICIDAFYKRIKVNEKDIPFKDILDVKIL